MGIIIDKAANAEILKTLDELNVLYYKSCSLDFLYKPVNTHPDMQIHFVNENEGIVAPSAYEHYKKILPNHITLTIGSSDPSCTYPGDCAYNVAKLGKKIIGNLRYTDTKILDYYSAQGCEFINVNQGYTKCNLCIVDDNSAITEDEGLCKTLSKAGLDILKIPAGSVMLPGFSHGFIGGASGFVLKNMLAFGGNINDECIKNNIIKFVKSKYVDIIFLSSTKLADLGSILYFNTSF